MDPRTIQSILLFVLALIVTGVVYKCTDWTYKRFLEARVNRAKAWLVKQRWWFHLAICLSSTQSGIQLGLRLEHVGFGSAAFVALAFIAYALGVLALIEFYYFERCCIVWLIEQMKPGLMGFQALANRASERWQR
jgi:hypothetical protein